jgi:hypothetical protein
VRAAAAGAAAVLGALVASATVGAHEYTQFELVSITPVRQEALRPLPALLNLPPGWRSGDAIAVLQFTRDSRNALHDRVLSALLDQGAAVLELPSGTAQGFLPQGVAAAPPDAQRYREDISAAATVLARDYAPGLIVALGDAEAIAALRDVPPGAVAGIAAFASVDPAPAAFRLALPPPASEDWSRRAPLLCDALAFARSATATPVPVGEAEEKTQAYRTACRDALLAPR